MTNMNAIELMKAVDHASGMNDRWLFIASLVLIGSFGMWVMRYFVKQHERLITDHKHSWECYQTSLRKVWRSRARRMRSLSFAWITIRRFWSSVATSYGARAEKTNNER